VGPPPTSGPDGRYQRLRPHARGGLGEVWVAADRELEREVALKEILEQHAHLADSRARFLLEARVTGGLEHPGIVPVYGLGHHPDGRPYYAMRFIKGDSLRRAIEQFHQADWRGKPGERALALRQLLGRFIDVCDAVEYAHSRGVLHRDLKPGNVMLGKYGETLVVDWGLAKLSGAEAEATEGGLAVSSGDSGLTQAGKALGTPAYMSPEQAAGRLDQLGPRSDVYSLGATLYTLLTNQAPFAQGEMGEVLARVERGDFPPPRQVNKEVPRALEAVCLKAMARDPAQRYGSPRALAGDLEHWLADEPVGSYREPWSGRARRWLKRYRTAVIGGVAVLVLAAAGLAVATALLSAKNDELTRANADAQAAREQAQKNFETAVQAVEDYLTGVAENDRLQEKDLEPLRRDLFRSAQAYYRRFAEQQRGSPKYRSLVAQADVALGRIHWELGEGEQARDHYGRAVAALRELADTEPAVFAHRERLARATLNMSHALWGKSDFAGTEAWARDCLRLAEHLGKDFPGERAPRRHAVSAHLKLGWAAKELGRLAESEREYVAALRLQERLAEEAANDWRERLELVKCHAQLGDLYVTYLQRSADSEKAFRTALGLLDGLDREAQKRPKVRTERGYCQRGLANALLKGGNSREAEEHFRAAVRACEQLAAEFPLLPSSREALYDALFDLARCLSWQARYKDERELVGRWVELSEKLRNDFSTIPYYRLCVARAYNESGRLEYQVGDKEESIRQRQKAVATLTALVNEFPKIPIYRVELSVCQNGLCFAFLNLNRFADALAASSSAIEVIRPLADPSAGVPDNQFRYAQALLNHCQALHLNGKSADALAPARELVAVLERLNGQTDNVEYQASLGGAYTTLAVAQWKCGHPQEARQELDRSIRNLEEILLRDTKLALSRRSLQRAHIWRCQFLAGLDLDAAEVKHGQRALSLAHAGKFNQAVQEADTLAAGDGLSAEGCYTLARVYALLAAARKKDDAKGREGDAGRAVELLVRARDAGYFREAARVDRLRREPDLAPLRDRADFKGVLAGVSKKKP
jgi:serine/threonine-protein kinase